MLGASVRWTDYELSCDKIAFYSRPFENVNMCLNRAYNALAILIFRELLHLFMRNKGICTNTLDRHITKSKPRAAVKVFNTNPISDDSNCFFFTQSPLLSRVQWEHNNSILMWPLFDFNGDRAARRPHVLCLICVRSFGSLVKMCDFSTLSLRFSGGNGGRGSQCNSPLSSSYELLIDAYGLTLTVLSYFADPNSVCVHSAMRPTWIGWQIPL